VPELPEDYVHRVGRTGRAQNVGDEFTLMSGHEVSALQAIEHFIGQKIPRLKLENFPTYSRRCLNPSRRPASGRSPGEQLTGDIHLDTGGKIARRLHVFE